MRLNLFLKVGAVLVLVGMVGYSYIFPNFFAIDGQEFTGQVTKDANNIESFSDYGAGDKIIILDKISRIQLKGELNGTDSQTHVWLESIGKSETDIRFVFDSNLMNDFGVDSNVVITFEIVNLGQGESVKDEAINPRLSTIHEYSFVSLIVIGFGLIGYGFYSGIGSKQQPDVEDVWGLQATAAPPVAPPVAPMQPMAPASSAPIPQPTSAVPPPQPMAPPVNSPSTMTITVPPGVVAGQVLTVTMPNGQVVNVEVPSGSSSGSQFTITMKQ